MLIRFQVWIRELVTVCRTSGLSVDLEILYLIHHQGLVWICTIGGACPRAADLTEIEPIRHIVTEGIGEYPRERYGRIEIAVAIRVQGGEPVVTSRQVQEHLVLPSEVRRSVYGVHPGIPNSPSSIVYR